MVTLICFCQLASSERKVKRCCHTSHTPQKTQVLSFPARCRRLIKLKTLYLLCDRAQKYAEVGLKMIKIIVLWLLVCCTSYTLSSFSSTGVPCYLHPSADGCHYRVRPDSNNCSTPAQRESVSKRIAIVNRTLISLEQQLIRLGVSKGYIS